MEGCSCDERDDVFFNLVRSDQRFSERLQSGVLCRHRIMVVGALLVLFYWAVRFAGEENEAHGFQLVFCPDICSDPSVD